MSRLSSVRRRLAEQQAALLAALLGDSDLPPGFDPADAAAAASVLSRRTHASRFWHRAHRFGAVAAGSEPPYRGEVIAISYT